MSPELPSWLKRSGSVRVNAEAVRKITDNTHEAEIFEKAVALEEDVKHCLETWNRLGIDNILNDLQIWYNAEGVSAQDLNFSHFTIYHDKNKFVVYAKISSWDSYPERQELPKLLPAIVIGLNERESYFHDNRFKEISFSGISRSVYSNGIEDSGSGGDSAHSVSSDSIKISLDKMGGITAWKKYLGQVRTSDELKGLLDAEISSSFHS